MRPRSSGLAVSWLLATFTVASRAAADDALVTDRPDFTDSALVVDTGRWQLDARVGRRLSYAGPDGLPGVGASWRY